jgi:uncharacterized protein
MDLTCPKCSGSMRSYERVGIVIDQCSECRGVYLDRGELEKLIDAEAGQTWAAGGAPSRAAPAWETPEPPRRDDRYRRYGYDDHRFSGHGDDRDREDHRYGDPRYGKKRRKSFLEELFD